MVRAGDDPATQVSTVFRDGFERVLRLEACASPAGEKRPVEWSIALCQQAARFTPGHWCNLAS